MAELFRKIKLHAEEACNFSRKSTQPLVFDSIFVNYSVNKSQTTNKVKRRIQ